MKVLLKQAWKRFRSEVPPTIKKIQIVLGSAAGMFTAGALITWPGKLAIIGTICSYGAAVCAGIPLALQFLEQTVTVFETKTELTIKQTTTATEVPVDEKP